MKILSFTFLQKEVKYNDASLLQITTIITTIIIIERKKRRGNKIIKITVIL